MHSLAIGAVLLTAFLTSCAHDSAWIADKAKTGGRIGYSQSTFDDDPDKVAKDFNKAADKLCGKGAWKVVREIIPPPISALGAAREASKGNAGAAADLGGRAYLHDTLYRNRRVSKQVKVEYGSPLKSWNEAEIRCNRS